MSLDGDIRLLSRVKLFAGFSPDHLRLLAFGAEARTLGMGTRLYRKGVPSDGGYVVVHGKVELISGPNDDKGAEGDEEPAEVDQNVLEERHGQ